MPLEYTNTPFARKQPGRYIEAANEDMLDILESIALERANQLRKWGEQNHSLSGWVVINLEELGEYAKAVFDYAQGKSDVQPVVTEGIQACATVVAALEYIARANRTSIGPRPGIVPTRPA